MFEARDQEAKLSLNAAVQRIGHRVGVNPDTLRGWAKQAEIDDGRRLGTTTAESARIRDLEREVRELKRANEMAGSPVDSANLEGSVGFLRGGAGPPVQEVIAFIDANRYRRSVDGLVWGVEPICAVGGIAPQTYHAAEKRPLSARVVRDAELNVEIQRVYDANLQVYGADKVWAHLNKDGIQVGRCRVERLMREMGVTGCRRGRTWVRTTARYTQPE